jgi:HSP20 family protein
MNRFNMLDRTWRRDPWNPLAAVQDQVRAVDRAMDRWFQLANDAHAPGLPAVDIWAKDDEVIVEAELPGVEAEDVDIAVEGDVLTLRGKRGGSPDEEARPYRQERGFGEFSRSFRLPFRVEAGSVDARFANGVLEIKLPRAEADRPRRIAVQAS